MATVIRRFGAPAAFALVGAGLQLSGYQNLPLAIALWVAAAVWLLVLGVVSFRDWRAKRQTFATDGSLLNEPVRRATKEQVEARRFVMEKKKRGEKLSRGERKLLADTAMTRAGFLELLSYHQTLGRPHLDRIQDAAERFDRELDRLQERDADEGAIRQRLEELHDDDDSVEKSQEWEKSVAGFLEKYLGHLYRARFEDEAGLIPSGHSPGGRRRHTEAWKRHEMRLQRLSEIIRELSNKWNI